MKPVRRGQSTRYGHYYLLIMWPLMILSNARAARLVQPKQKTLATNLPATASSVTIKHF